MIHPFFNHSLARKRSAAAFSLRWAWLCLLIIAGCGTTPQTRYYLLTAGPAPDASRPVALTNLQPAPSQSATLSSAAEVRRIGVGPVKVSDYLQRPQIITSEGQTALTLAEFDRWAEPLEESVSRILVENIAQLTGVPVIVFPWRRDERPDIALRLNLQHLDRQQGQAWLKAHWRLADSMTGAVISEGQLSITRALPDDRYDTLAQAYSGLLYELSLRLIDELRQTRAKDRLENRMKDAG